MAKQLNAEEIQDQLSGLVEKIRKDLLKELIDEMRAAGRMHPATDEYEPAIEFIKSNYVI